MVGIGKTTALLINKWFQYTCMVVTVSETCWTGASSHEDCTFADWECRLLRDVRVQGFTDRVPNYYMKLYC